MNPKNQTQHNIPGWNKPTVKDRLGANGNVSLKLGYATSRTPAPGCRPRAWGSLAHSPPGSLITSWAPPGLLELLGKRRHIGSRAEAPHIRCGRSQRTIVSRLGKDRSHIKKADLQLSSEPGPAFLLSLVQHGFCHPPYPAVDAFTHLLGLGGACV